MIFYKLVRCSPPTHHAESGSRSQLKAMKVVSTPLFFMLIRSNVSVCDMMCNIHNSTMRTQGEGHKFAPLISCSLNIS